MGSPENGSGLSVRLLQENPIPLDVEISAAPGEVLALVGPSGSGKSTTLRAIAGLYRPAGGHVACNGTVWCDCGGGVWVPARKRRIGLVFQSYALFPHLTALENVMEALTDLPARDRPEMARGLLGRLSLAGLENRRPAGLSGGQQQRVALARALGRRPDILLLDEPFSAVDRPTRRALRRELLGLRGELSMPTVLVTHDLDDVVRLANRIAVIDRGRILQHGPTHEVLAHPAIPRVADLLDLAADERLP